MVTLKDIVSYEMYKSVGHSSWDTSNSVAPSISCIHPNSQREYLQMVPL